MTRQEILQQIEEAYGSVPGFLTGMPDAMLALHWETTKWAENDSALSARDKALVAYGAAGAVHCEY